MNALRVKLALTAGSENKLGSWIVFAVIYGLVFINYIDLASSSLTYGYHLWLVLMYFLPFIGFSMLDLKNWTLTISLGLLASLMNDIFYGVMASLTVPFNLTRYYNLWLIPHTDILFHLNLGFIVLPVYSWLMALSIYLRIAAVAALLWKWKCGRRQTAGSSKLSASCFPAGMREIEP